MTIQRDSREKPHAIKKIIAEFDRQGVKHISSKCFVGDYISLDNSFLAIDRKQHLTELCQNVCQDHERLRNEILRATENGIKIIFLIEHGCDIKCLEDVKTWVNPRLKKSPKATTGERLYKTMRSMLDKKDEAGNPAYNIDFMFCNKDETGAKIIELLSGDEEKKIAKIIDKNESSDHLFS